MFLKSTTDYFVRLYHPPFSCRDSDRRFGGLGKRIPLRPPVSSPSGTRPSPAFEITDYFVRRRYARTLQFSSPHKRDALVPDLPCVVPDALHPGPIEWWRPQRSPAAPDQWAHHQPHPPPKFLQQAWAVSVPDLAVCRTTGAPRSKTEAPDRPWASSKGASGAGVLSGRCRTSLRETVRFGGGSESFRDVQNWSRNASSLCWSRPRRQRSLDLAGLVPRGPRMPPPTQHNSPKTSCVG